MAFLYLKNMNGIENSKPLPTPEEIEVLSEVITAVKDNSGIIHANSLRQRVTYDYNHGTGASLELIKKHCGYLLQNGGFNEEQLTRLSRMLSYSNKTVKVKSIEDIDWNDISYDGHGYVIMRDGTRVEFEEEA